MSEKVWKIFGIIGIVSLAGILICLIFNFFVGFKKYSTIRYGEELVSPGLKAISPTPSAIPTEAETVFKTESETPSRMIIKTGWLNLVVKDVLETIRKISKFAEENGGWVVSSNVSEYEKVPSGSITVRVPAEKFDQANNYFRSLAVRVSHESTQSQDITEEYVDLKARLKNLEAAESQLLELMKRTGKISEILEVQRELTNTRQQIEQIKGRMQYLEQSVKMSSITVNLALSEELLPIPPAEKWRPKYVLLQAWKSVLGFWKGLSYFLIRLVVWAQVWVPVVLIVYFGLRFCKKRKTQKLTEK